MYFISINIYAQTYINDIQPIFMGKCSRCHNSQAQYLPNWLDYKQAFADRREIKRRVWDSWKGIYYKQSMPAGNSPECQSITEEDRKTIKNWVDSGGVYGNPSDPSNKTKDQQIESGKRLFAIICSTCHQPDGKGIPNQFPPLAQSDFLNYNKKMVIGILIRGRQGEIVVNGMKFNNSMPSFPLNDEDIADVLTFVYSSFGNSGKQVVSKEVASIRELKDVPVASQEIVHSSESNPFE